MALRTKSEAVAEYDEERAAWHVAAGVLAIIMPVLIGYTYWNLSTEELPSPPPSIQCICP